MVYKKLTLTFVSIPFLLISIVSTFDYCNIEVVEDSCMDKQHVGCDKSVFEGDVDPYDIVPMTEELKEFILNELNMFRSDVAMGEYEYKGLPPASNMRSMRWNNEFGDLANLLIKRVGYGDFSACIQTEEFEKPWETHYKRYGLLDNEELFQRVIRSETSENNNLTSGEESEYFNAFNHQIGCAFGNLIDENGDSEFLIKFIQKERYGNSVKHSYDFGIPCSKCYMYDEVCDTDQYPGLCVPKSTQPEIQMVETVKIGIKAEKSEKGKKRNKGEKGDMGEKGDKGDIGNRGKKGDRGLIGDRGPIGHPGISVKGSTGAPGRAEKGEPGTIGPAGPETVINNFDFKYPISFWILYSILGFGVLLALILSSRRGDNNFNNEIN